MLQKIKGTAGRFLRDTRGGATSIAAVAVTIMTMGGAALIIDHNHLVGQRDILKSASDAASRRSSASNSGLAGSACPFLQAWESCSRP